MLSPQLTQLVEETRSTMVVLAHTVKSQKSHLSLPEIEVALSNATEQFNNLQAIQQQGYAIDELVRFFTFFYTMEEVGRKLQRMADILSCSTNL